MTPEDRGRKARQECRAFRVNDGVCLDCVVEAIREAEAAAYRRGLEDAAGIPGKYIRDHRKAVECVAEIHALAEKEADGPG